MQYIWNIPIILLYCLIYKFYAFLFLLLKNWFYWRKICNLYMKI
nr:MAG TPA: hypothetical protein [Caudoviricetes sp.]